MSAGNIRSRRDACNTPLRECRARRIVGRQTFSGQRRELDIEVRIGAGAYICGEETALLNSIEGRRGRAPQQAAFPTQVGLFGRPTVINNVETLINVPHIILEGGAAFAAIGTERSTGTKLFCLSGMLCKPGVYEAPFGITLRQILNWRRLGRQRKIAGHPAGGAAGAFVGPDNLDIPLTFEGTRAAGNAGLSRGDAL